MHIDQWTLIIALAFDVRVYMQSICVYNLNIKLYVSHGQIICLQFIQNICTYAHRPRYEHTAVLYLYTFTCTHNYLFL